MAQSLELIIAADRHAAKIVSEAREDRARILAAAKQEESDALEESAKKLEELQTNLITENDAYKKSVKAKCDAVFAQQKDVLDKQFSSGKDEWISKIYNKITTV